MKRLSVGRRRGQGSGWVISPDGIEGLRSVARKIEREDYCADKNR